MLRPVRPARDEEEKTASTVLPQEPARVWNGTLRRSGSPRWDVVAEINPRTIQWLGLAAGQRLSYFPPDNPLAPETIDSLNTGPFPVLFFDGQNAIVLLDCTSAGMNPGNKP